jgi:hypothetical protein
MDEESAAIARALDPARPVIPASGIYDQHLYHGWYTGAWFDNRDLHPSFPTEFGVQALPNLESPFWATVNNNWPVDADDVSWAHSGYQSAFWAGPGVGHPAQYKSLAEYVAESQAYQAFFIRYCIDQWRRQKFDPVGGYIHFLFTDGWPAITWSVLDYFRLPKEGYRALAEASRPARVCFDLEGGFTVEHGFRIVFAEGNALKLGLWVVNDDYRLAGEAEVRWWIEARGGGVWSRLRRAIRWATPKRFPARLPRADDGATLIARIEAPLKRSGHFTFITQLRLGNGVLDENRLSFRVGEPKAHHAPRRRVPGLLVNKVYDYGSLRHTGDGFTFSLRNPSMPVRLNRLIELRADGQALDLALVELVHGGVSRRASSISPQAAFEIPSGEPFAIVARGHRLEAGLHELEFVAEFMGLGEIAARVRDKLI